MDRVIFMHAAPASLEDHLAGLRDEIDDLALALGGRRLRRGTLIEVLPPWYGNYRCRRVVCAEHPLDRIQLDALCALLANDNALKGPLP